MAPRRRHTYALAAALLGLVGGCAPRPETPSFRPELVLDIERPEVTVAVGDVLLRLRVDLDRRNTIELNPAAARRLPLEFQGGSGVQVGRETVAERTAAALVVLDGITAPQTFSVFDRECCVGVDGAIGPDLLPYDRVRFVRGTMAARGTERRFPLVQDDERGLAVRQLTAAGEILVQFSLRYPGVLATAAAGAILARAHDGRLVGETFQVTPALGVSRPVRTLRFARPARLAGFVLTDVPVRLADFRGGFALPQEQARPGDILVAPRRARAQEAWPSLLIGREQLDRCDEIIFHRLPIEIVLRCDFAAP
ncbi:MAG: hypothetical protein JWM75_417 [Sphingomonas bacterium]|nr:hypothetical protein [Sphingomonas bacterium]